MPVCRPGQRAANNNSLAKTHRLTNSIMLSKIAATKLNQNFATFRKSIVPKEFRRSGRGSNPASENASGGVYRQWKRCQGAANGILIEILRSERSVIPDVLPPSQFGPKRRSIASQMGRANGKKPKGNRRQNPTMRGTSIDALTPNAKRPSTNVEVGMAEVSP